MTPSKVQTGVPEADNMADTLQEIWQETGMALRLAKERMAGREPGEVPEVFDIGERVWLDSRNLRLRTNSVKLTVLVLYKPSGSQDCYHVMLLHCYALGCY
jgi:hypothetical protein